MVDENEIKTQHKQPSKTVNKKAEILNSKEPLPINVRILSLLSLIQKEPTKNVAKAKKILLQIEEIDSNFNAAEQYLMFFIHGLIEHNDGNETKAITWLNKTSDLHEKIPSTNSKQKEEADKKGK